MSARLHINPRYRDLLHAQGLTTVRAFLDLSGVIYCGHPNRNVARVDLGDGVSTFLKKEHRVPWRDRHPLGDATASPFCSPPPPALRRSSCVRPSVSTTRRWSS